MLKHSIILIPNISSNLAHSVFRLLFYGWTDVRLLNGPLIL
uniref:Uncharacterized protein n=1 Tax=Arundo donax TaxID=35708 RepID=A0A0A9CXF3_ARUDO